jgi:hypothetical protein
VVVLALGGVAGELRGGGDMDGVRAASHSEWAVELQQEHSGVKEGGKKGVGPAPVTRDAVTGELGGMGIWMG